MTTQSIDQLIRENEGLRRRLEDAEEALRALGTGEADAILVRAESEQVYTIESADKPYRLLVEQVGSAAATLTSAGEIIYCNAYFGELVGLPIGTLIGRPISGMVTSEDRPLLALMLRDGHTAPIEGDVVFRRDDGSRVVAHIGLSHVEVGAQGSCLVLTDLTERKRYRELHSALEALRVASERLELAQQAGQIGIYDWNVEADELSWSASMEKQYGLPPGTFKGRYSAWKPFVHPDDLARVEAEVRQAVVERGEVVTEYRILRPDGQTRWLSVRGRVLCDSENQPLRLVGVSLDVTEQKSAEAERERLLALEQDARAQAERAVRARDEVLAFVAHDLRNPLLAIEMSASTVMSCSNDKDRRECLDMIQRCTREMRRLISDLLDAARMESGTFSVRPATTEIAPVLHEVMDMFRPQAETGDITVECEIAPGLPAASADRDRLIQVLSNLLGNALKFTPAGGRVHLTARRAGEAIEISVADSGGGVPPEDLPRLFERFWQGDRTSGLGAGLGLSICKRIVDALGGTIRAESTIGLGTTIRFTLPLA